MGHKQWRILCKMSVFFVGIHFFRFCFAEDTIVKLSGDISDVTFTNYKQIYHIDSTIEIPPGKSIAIPEGTIFLFNIGTAFIINGSCAITGTNTNVVIFTSINDSTYSSSSISPTPFDWDGITVHNSADSIFFKHLQIRYAELALNSADSTITLDSVSRSLTRQSYFQINEKQFKVKNDEFFSYHPLQQPDTTTKVVPPVPSLSLDKPPTEKPWWKQKKVQWSLLGTGSAAILASGGSIIGYLVNHADSTEAWKNSHQTGLSLTENEYNEKKDLQYESGKRAFYFRHASIVGGIIGVVLLSGFTLTVVF